MALSKIPKSPVSKNIVSANSAKKITESQAGILFLVELSTCN